MTPGEVNQNFILRGPLFPEPVRGAMTVSMGGSLKIIGSGPHTNQFYQPILSAEKIALLEASPEREPFDGDARKFSLGNEVFRLGLAYEYDPYFSLSIARVDPLPHQLDAVYDYFMRLPRIRFLLADDPGAGKTIMAGLLINEYKTAQRLGRDYWLYTHCASTPTLNIFRDPAKLDWQAVVKVEHYKLRPDSPTSPVTLREDPPEL